MIDVARRAGVSSMTVSRALKPNTSVSDGTRERIQKAADELGYVLDSTAAGLSSSRTGFIAVTIPSINNANFADTLRGIVERLRDTNMQVLLGYTNYSTAEEERLIEQFLQRRPEAIVMTGGAHTERCRMLIENSGVPIVETWDLPEVPLGDVVGFSNAEAGRLMVRHFYDQGYRKIGFIGGDTSRDTRGLDRRRGFVQALEELGLETDRLIGSGPPPISMREGAASMKKMLSDWPDTDAVMCVSDLSAFGALTECQRAGMRVPDDIAIAGFGAYDIAEHAIPAITTVDAAALSIGENTAEILLRRLGDADEETPAPSTLIAPKLLARGSTVRPL
ncbi:MAG: LacI family DNA-binding transcriptional regulator [Hyphomicrobiales bacterium]|nr:LacI family DNA-binding transcriptional regulator [Hyphomicrobiales bacterium]MCP4999546.1 LacI family DNA-binding transcriptional regulator [Hyphomicrobiales bacterium]